MYSLTCLNCAIMLLLCGYYCFLGSIAYIHGGMIHGGMIHRFSYLEVSIGKYLRIKVMPLVSILRVIHFKADWF